MRGFYTVLILILIDLIVGTIRALFIDKDWSSRVFRYGLYKKVSEIAIVLTGFFIDEYCLNLFEYSLNLYVMTGVYIVVMESLSILENFSDDKDLKKLVSTVKRVLLKFKDDNGGDDSNGC